jgi:hypothetical protein
MRGILGIWIFGCLIVFANFATAQNLLINPSFDETPWDTGWTIETQGDAGGEVDTGIYRSLPQSCKLVAYQYHSSLPFGEVTIVQEIAPARCCTCRVYFQNSINLFWAGGTVSISLKINGNWVTEWSSREGNPIWIKWEKIYGSTDTVSGIKFYAEAYTRMNGSIGRTKFWIDDVYIGGEVVGVEESAKCKVQNAKLEIYPNPFQSQTTMRYSSFNKKDNINIRIYDLSGRTIREFKCIRNQIVWDGKDENGKWVSPGVYFVRLQEVNKSKESSIKKLIKL